MTSCAVCAKLEAELEELRARARTEANTKTATLGRAELRALAGAAGEADIHCLYSSFRRMVSEPELFAEQGQRDFIYAAGLFDYLRPLLAQRLIKKLMGTVAPGGLR